jgi:ubiquinone/menaquinone biosynthesis C-methylase UbiE
MQPNAETAILDVGGYVHNWLGIVPIQSPVTVVNLSHPNAAEPLPEGYTRVVGDARKLPFSDSTFDIVFSNSVIEHVGSFEDQRSVAQEVRRVGKRYFVQTPNRWFFIEPHFITLFVHFLPWSLARKLIRVFSFRGLVRSGDNVNLKELADGLRFLSLRELKELFPDAEIVREKWLGFTKSFIAVRR